MNFDFEKIKKFFVSNKQRSNQLRFWAGIFLTILLSYVLASIISPIIANFILGAQPLSRGRVATKQQVDFSKKVNYRDVRKSVLKRNIFNSEGKVPDSDSSSLGQMASNTSECNKPTLNLKVVGTIYLGGKDSVVTVREANYSQADTYKVSDTIIGYDNVYVVAIEREQMILDNGGSRECYEIEKKVLSANRPSNYSNIAANKKKKTTRVNEGSSVVLESAWVEKELGTGFSKVIQSARLVPNTADDGRVNGFKIFAIKPGTLFNKVGLRNGDIIQKVNDISLEQVEQGFALYQTFQEDQEIVFNIVRKDSPHTISVMIK